jgi:hypothetical protein
MRIFVMEERSLSMSAGEWKSGKHCKWADRGCGYSLGVLAHKCHGKLQSMEIITWNTGSRL